jgi:hypothetical protein
MTKPKELELKGTIRTYLTTFKFLPPSIIPRHINTHNTLIHHPHEGRIVFITLG